jgi:hypothetical protein
MALFEVSIEGFSVSGLSSDEEFEVSPYLGQDFTFLQKGKDLIGTLMSAQEKVDRLNEALMLKYPSAFKDEFYRFKINGIVETAVIEFNDAWMRKFVEEGIVNHEEPSN